MKEFIVFKRRTDFGHSTKWHNIQLDAGVKIGYGRIKIPRNAHISDEVKIYDGAIIREGTIIYTGCIIGENTMIGHHCVIREAVNIGNNCIVGHHVVFEGCVKVGDCTAIHSQCHITSYSEIGSYVCIGPMTVTANDPVMSHYRKNIEVPPKGPTICDGARVAAGCVILPGVTIGREAVIGAGSLVTKDVPDYMVAYGSPAKVTMRIPDTALLKNNGVEV